MNHNDQEIRKKIRKYDVSKNLRRPLKAFTFEMGAPAHFTSEAKTTKFYISQFTRATKN